MAKRSFTSINFDFYCAPKYPAWLNALCDEHKNWYSPDYCSSQVWKDAIKKTGLLANAGVGVVQIRHALFGTKDFVKSFRPPHRLGDYYQVEKYFELDIAPIAKLPTRLERQLALFERDREALLAMVNAYGWDFTLATKTVDFVLERLMAMEQPSARLCCKLPDGQTTPTPAIIEADGRRLTLETEILENRGYFDKTEDISTLTSIFRETWSIPIHIDRFADEVIFRFHEITQAIEASDHLVELEKLNLFLIFGGPIASPCQLGGVERISIGRNPPRLTAVVRFSQIELEVWNNLRYAKVFEERLRLAYEKMLDRAEKAGKLVGRSDTEKVLNEAIQHTFS